MYEYEVKLHWSEDDGVFVAEAPELPGCMAHGETEEVAREQIGQAMELWLDTAREFGDPIPAPKTGWLKDWDGLDSPICRYVSDETQRALDAYRSQQSLVDEQANQEQDKARGGYADRQIVELVQNAGDQLSRFGDRIKIRLTRTHLYVADDGCPIDEEGARALMFSYLSPKRGTEEIGRFGVGFKSVLAVTDLASIFSRSGSFIFDRAWAASLIGGAAPDAHDYPVLRVAKPADPRVEASGDPILASFMQWAVNIVRLRLKGDAHDKIAEQIRAFDAAFLLFVPHVKRLTMVSDDDTVPERALCMQEREGQSKLEDGSESSRWKLFRRPHRLSGSAQRDRRGLDDAEEIHVTWAASLDPQSRHHHFWAYFPTQTHSLVPGIFNAPWKTNEDRRNLLPGAYNNDVIDAAARLVADSVTDLRTEEDPARHLDGLGGRIDADLNEHARRLAGAVYRELQTRAVVPDLDGTLRRPDEIAIRPDLSELDSDVEDEVTRRWSDYRHRPAGWLHERGLTNNRLATFGRIQRGNGERGPSPHRASIAKWLGALTEAGAVAGDEVTASRTAIQIAALLRSRPSWQPVGNIVLTADCGWTSPEPGTVYLSGTEEIAAARLVHPDVEADCKTLTALQKLGVTRVAPPTPKEELNRLARKLLRDYSYPYRYRRDEPSDEEWRRFWEVARSIDRHAAIDIIESVSTAWGRGVRHVRVLTLAGVWEQVREVLLPGPVVPDDGSRDPQVAVDVKFHEPDLPVLQELGARTEPAPDYEHFDRQWKPYDEYLDCCIEQYRKQDGLPNNPQSAKLTIEKPNIGPLEAFVRLSDEGRASFTEALLELDETFRPWIMFHATRREVYPDVRFPSLVVDLLRKHGCVRTEDSVRKLSDGLGDPPQSPDVQQWLLDHPKSRLIRHAFDDLSKEASAEPAGEDEPTPIADEWPGLSDLLGDGNPWLLVRCDRLLGPDGQDAQFDCICRKRTLYVVRHVDEADELRAVIRELDLDVDEHDFRRILLRETQADVRAERRSIAEKSTDAERLLAAVGEDDLRMHLPRGLARILRQEDIPFSGERVAKAAIATYHTGALHRYRDSLQGLEPPTQWAGSRSAVEFVRDLGFGAEWAGQRRTKRPPFEDVAGPCRLPPLHQYQKDAVANVRALLRARTAGGENRGLLSLPTGSGKTRVAVEAIIDAIREDGFPGAILWVADRDELCEQAVESWRQAWAAIGPKGKRLRISRMWGGQRRPVANDGIAVVIATRQTLVARGITASSADDPLGDVRLLVVDEAHGSIAPSYTSILAALGLTHRRSEDEICLLGLTATPYRGRNEEETDRLVNRYGGNRLDRGVFPSDDAERVIHDLQGMNVLAHADHDTIQGSSERLQDDETREIERKNLAWLPESVERRIADDVERTGRIISAYMTRIRDVDPSWPTLVFATSVAHAETVAAILQMKGVEARAVSGTTDPTVRRSAIERFRNGEVKVLVNYGVFREGFDAPKTQAIIVARPVYSPNLYFQMIGRGLRGKLNGGSDRCLILDVEDNIENYDMALAFSELDWLWTDLE